MIMSFKTTHNITKKVVICITRRCGPNHYAFHSFFSGLDQFHYNDIIMTSHPNLMGLASEQGHVVMTSGILMD